MGHDDNDEITAQVLSAEAKPTFPRHVLAAWRNRARAIRSTPPLVPGALLLRDLQRPCQQAHRKLR
jgi:hypothetical protein